MSSSIIPEFEAANEQYAAPFDKGDLTLPPSRHVTVLACMDARLDPTQFLGIELGSAHVIRNAGGRAADALRSIIISQQLLGTREIVVVHHTDCGMLTFSDMGLKAKLRKELDQDVDHMAFLPFGDLEQSVRDDVAFLKKSPLVLDVPITGFIYDVKSGKINKVDVSMDGGIRLKVQYQLCS
ncbi:carbonic anhydrase [Fusarium oxysporum f. sp. conglutinans race 2 54008]|uniref:Carbonic anhydrase n=1 Tax=Fusarium oxysporum f. sp. conglutinans race 2 54008 TaxID=1089457 RepID=X0GZL0_FUSOX|nr:carbonic anhydrase [Fusarium oxysporum f. sp. conglutinans race 2 54008]